MTYSLATKHTLQTHRQTQHCSISATIRSAKNSWNFGVGRPISTTLGLLIDDMCTILHRRDLNSVPSWVVAPFWFRL